MTSDTPTNVEILKRCYPLTARFRGSKSLAGEDLTGFKLLGADLRGTDLSYCDLGNADLSGALLDGANLEGAKLRNTNCSVKSASDCNWNNSVWDWSYSLGV